MERLTKRMSENIIELSARANPIQYNGSAQRVHIKHPFWNVFNKLCDYEEAEDQGLLLRLPCKIGRKVFYAQKCLAPSCKGCKGFLRADNCYCQYKARIFEQKFDYRHLKAFGKSVFLSKEEAEQALARMEGENE